MIFPSGIKLPDGQSYRILETCNGSFTVENAYEGTYEFFEGRPISQHDGGKDAAIAADSSVATTQPDAS
jgi:hypothetical protein